MIDRSLAQTYDDLDKLFTAALRAIQASPLDLEHRVSQMSALWAKLDDCTNPTQVAALNDELRSVIAHYSQEVSHA